jgi:hypothetical protein
MRTHALLFAVFACGCIPKLTPDVIRSVRGPGDAALLVAPRSWHTYQPRGILMPQGPMGWYRSAAAPWAGEQLVGLKYNIWSQPVLVPMGVDVRGVLQQRMAAKARQTLKVDLVAEGRPSIDALNARLPASDVPPFTGWLEAVVDGPEHEADLAPLAAEGITTLWVVSVHRLELRLHEGMIAAGFGLEVFDTAQNRRIYQAFQGAYPWRVGTEVLQPFFPKELDTTPPLCDQQAEVIAKAPPPDAASVAALERLIADVVEQWLDLHLQAVPG